MAITLIILILLLALFWSKSLQAKHVATRAARNACEQQHFQLLDDTVELKRLGFTRVEGRLTFIRRYNFEYFKGGDYRMSSYIVLHGIQVAEIGIQTVSNVIQFPKQIN